MTNTTGKNRHKSRQPRLIASVTYSIPNPRAGQSLWDGSVAPDILSHTVYCPADKVDAARSRHPYAKKLAHLQPRVTFAFEKPVHKPTPGRDKRAAKEVRENMAIMYARWLAARDGVTLPVSHQSIVQVDWGFVHAPGNRYPKEHARAVEWGHAGTVVYDEYSYVIFVCDVRIEIPNWDFVPVEPIEEILGVG